MMTFQVGRTRRLATGALTATVAMAVLTGTAHAKDTHTLAYIGYSDNRGQGTILVSDADTHEEVTRIRVAGRPNGITATPDGNFIYVATESTPGVQIIDTHTHEIIQEVSVGGGWANKIAFNSGGDLAYVAQGSSGAGGSRGRVYIDDVATDQVIGSFKAGEWPTDIVITPDDTRAYVTSSESTNVWVIDLATQSLIATINMGGTSSPRLALSPDGSSLFVTSGARLSVIDVATNTIGKHLALSGRAAGVALSPDGARAYVGEVRESGFKGVVTTVDTSDLAKIGESVEVTVGKLAVSPNGAEVYVTGEEGNTDTVVLEAETGEIHTVLPALENDRPSTVTLVAVPND
ncbi:hypothetical protein [Kibdelosporangium aridum]|uniref:hypothetical protein n=1 Tax=Kibdelosporangium aridum TaxID=2030 RepID=UPI0035EF0EFC